MAMTPESVIAMGRTAMEVTLMVAAPLLLVALIVGLIISIFQAATQINEQTLSFIPKLVAVFVTLVLAGPWMLTIMTDYMRTIFSGIPQMIG
jgi:flagellar biosynthetic protein FliQ